MRSVRAVPMSGAQFRLSGDGYEASVASVGATLRTLRHRGRDLIAGFPADMPRPAMRGALLIPWPNRTADGVYRYGGRVHRLTVNEPQTQTASHGLLAWSEFTPRVVVTDRVVLSGVIAPQPGYPWRLRVDVEFRLDATGLTQEVSVVNEGDGVAPVGIGGHPYLVAGPPDDRSIDRWRLEVPADDVLLTSAERMLPTGLIAVGGHRSGALDFRDPRQVGDTIVNHAFTGLHRTGGRALARVTDGDGVGAEISWDERCAWVQVYTADEPVGAVRRNAIAIEPMTCPPDALNSGIDLLEVGPGHAVDAGWRIAAV